MNMAHHRCKRWLTGLLGSIVLGLGELVVHAVINTEETFSFAMPSANTLCPIQLSAAIDPILNQQAFTRARWGIEVQTLADHQTGPTMVYTNEANDYFVPASNVKLLTTAAALAHLGPGFRTHTSVYEERNTLAPGGTSEITELRVVGQGDPSLTTERLSDLAQQLKDQGIQHIDRLIVDDHYFQGSPFNPTWEWEDVQSGYGAPVNSLILNQNEIGVYLYPQSVGQPLRLVWINPSDSQGWQVVNRSITVHSSEPEWIRVGRDLGAPILYIDGQLHPDSNRDISAVSIPKPTEYFSQQFRTVLNQLGISVTSVVRAEPNSLPLNKQVGDMMASQPSLSMLEWLQSANRHSNNLATESLLLQLGVNHSLIPTVHDTHTTTLALALTQLSQTLGDLGVDATSYSIADGSGLSRRNLVSPGSLVETLQAMANHPWGAIYRDSLAIAATSGTLRNRFRDTPVAGNLYGKSGGLTGVASLSGYLDPPHYDPLVFSIILNHSTQSGRVNRQAVDEIVLQLAQLKHCH